MNDLLPFTHRNTQRRSAKRCGHDSFNQCYIHIYVDPVVVLISVIITSQLNIKAIRKLCWRQTFSRFTNQVCWVIKSSNLLQARTINGRGTHMFTFQMYKKAFPLEWYLDDVPPTCEECKLLKASYNTGTSLVISGVITHQGKKLEQIILQNIATPLEAKPTIRGALLVS